MVESDTTRSDESKASVTIAFVLKGTEYRLLAGAALLLILMRLPYLGVPVLNEDEAVYFYMARFTWEHGAPYIGAFDHKGPILYYLLAPVVHLAGNEVTWIRFFTNLYLLVSCAVVFAIARALFLPWLAPLAALSYGLFFSARLDGLATNAEILMMLPVLASFFFQLKFETERRSGWALAAGIAATLALFIKSTAFFTLAAMGLFMLLARTRNPPEARLKFVGGYLAGMAGTCGILFLALYSKGALPQFLFAYFTVNLRYVAYFGFQQTIYELLRLSGVALGETFSGVLASVSGAMLPSLRPLRSVDWLVAVIFAGSLVGVYMGRQIVEHYFLQLALPVALLPLTVIQRLPEKFSRSIPACILVLAMALNVTTVFKGLKGLIRGVERAHPLYSVARYLAENRNPDDTLFVASGSAMVYHLSGMRYPGRYFQPYQHAVPMGNITDSKSDFEATWSGQPTAWVLTHQEGNVKALGLAGRLESEYDRVTEIDGYRIYRRKH